MNRREFLLGSLGAALVVAAPSLVTASPAPEEIVWARTELSGVQVKLMSRERLVSWLASERVMLEQDATEQFGRPIEFEAIEEDGQTLIREPGTDIFRVVWRERLDLHPYWKTQLDL